MRLDTVIVIRVLDEDVLNGKAAFIEMAVDGKKVFKTEAAVESQLGADGKQYPAVRFSRPEDEPKKSCRDAGDLGRDSTKCDDCLLLFMDGKFICPECKKTTSKFADAGSTRTSMPPYRHWKPVNRKPPRRGNSRRIGKGRRY